MIRENGVADLIAVVDRGQSPAEALLDLHPEFVMIGGRFKLLSDRMANGALLPKRHQLKPIRVESRGKWSIDAETPYLFQQAMNAIGPDLRLAGKSIHVGAAA